MQDPLVQVGEPVEMEEEPPDSEGASEPETIKNLNIKEGKFERNLNICNGMEPSSKPKIPKLIFRPNTKIIMTELNNLIQTKLTAETTLIYTGTITALI